MIIILFNSKNIMEYRIEWRSLITGYTDNGIWFSEKDKSMLGFSIKEMNHKYKGEIHHWLSKR